MFFNIYFHKLASIPGPLLWKATRLRYVYSLLSGNLTVDVWRLHEKYGDVVRTAPDEVSFAREDALSDVFLSRPGRKTFLKDPIYFQSPPGEPPNMITAIDVNESARMRQVMLPAFTERALTKQEPTIQYYVSLFMDRLRDILVSPENAKEGTIINVLDWYNWYAFDVIGDLLLGESFDCLRDTRNHAWVQWIFRTFKGKAVCPSLNICNHNLSSVDTKSISSLGVRRRDSILPGPGICTSANDPRQHQEDAKGPLCNYSR